MSRRACFEEADLSDGLPAAGFYASTVTTSRLRRSSSGNRMVHVVHTLDDVAPGHDRVAEYFVLEGASPRGLQVARRRLVELYRACRREPEAGEEITPEDLLGSRLAVKVEHESFRGEIRLRVVGHRPLTAETEVPF